MRTLETTPSRVTQFLRGIGAEPAFRTAMFALGNMQREDRRRRRQPYSR